MYQAQPQCEEDIAVMEKLYDLAELYDASGEEYWNQIKSSVSYAVNQMMYYNILGKRKCESTNKHVNKRMRLY